MEEKVDYLYKILSQEDWGKSQNQDRLHLSREDDLFIHFSKEDQLERILSKYWKDRTDYVVLKIEVEKLVGEMAFETNPGGSAKYYHLYRGYIPVESIIAIKDYSLK